MNCKFEKWHASAIGEGKKQRFWIVIGEPGKHDRHAVGNFLFSDGASAEYSLGERFSKYIASAKAVDTGNRVEDAEKESFRDEFRTLMNEGQSGSKLLYSIGFIGVFVSVATIWPLILALYGIPKINGK